MFHRPGRSLDTWGFVAKFRQAQAPGTDLDFADFPLAKPGVPAKQCGFG